MLTKEDWNTLDEESRKLFKSLLAEEGRSLEFDSRARPPASDVEIALRAHSFPRI
jgi:hypothetical protein